MLRKGSAENEEVRSEMCCMIKVSVRRGTPTEWCSEVNAKYVERKEADKRCNREEMDSNYESVTVLVQFCLFF